MTTYAAKLKVILSRHLKRTRDRSGLSQDAMSELLHIAPRSYIELEMGRSLCSTCTMIFYLLHSDKSDVLALLDEIRAAFAAEEKGDAA